MNRKLFLVVLVLAALVPAGLGINCYICNNVDDKDGCGHGKDGKEQRFLHSCDDRTKNLDYVEGQTYNLCRKIVTSIEFNVNENKATERITRKCGYLESKYDEECYYRGGFGGRQRTCTCKTDGCNSAFTTGASAPLLVGAVGLIYAITKFY